MAGEKCAHPNCNCNTAEHQAAANQQYCSNHCANEASDASKECECGHSDCQRK